MHNNRTVGPSLVLSPRSNADLLIVGCLPHRYLPGPEHGGRSSLLNALNQQGALGYRWLADEGVLEKEPHPRNYEYEAAEGFTRKSRDRSYEFLLQQGFEPVGEFFPEQIVVREVGEQRPAGSRKPVRVLDAMRGRKLMEHVAELAKENFRYRSTEYSQKGGGRALSMELCGTECGGPFEYRSFEVDNAAQLERDLNQLGREGFRVVPKSLGRSPELTERAANHAQRFTYRIAAVADASTVEQALNEGDHDGFVPIGVTAHVGWSVHTLMILEKTTSEAPQ
jgi:hypothetical protein